MIEQWIRTAIDEDVGTGDITSLATLPENHVSSGSVRAKAVGIFCGMGIANKVFHTVDPALNIRWHMTDGSAVKPQTRIVDVQGSTRSILSAERTVLNYLQRLSGIATLTRRFVDAVAGTGTKIIDTRKTTPGYRESEKYAVWCGGGTNHRMGLYDMFLIKDNHITASGSITAAVQRAVEYNRQMPDPCAIEVEVKTLDELNECLSLPIHRIMLDNMNISDMHDAVKRVAGKFEIEASGGITLANVRAVAETGVDFISVGALTHSAPALDLTLLLD
jgi:nicotinate-nucleotide pyrophosphorylase (carboxylating)